MRFYLRKERNFLSEKMVIFFEENDCSDKMEIGSVLAA